MDQGLIEPAGLATTARRIAFFGGSFDPPHLGHLAVARAARAGLDLDIVLFAPVGAQPLKSHGATAGFQDRLDLTRLAIAGEPGFAVSLADAPTASGAPNYTIDALLSVRAQLHADAVLFCLMGADSFSGLRQWLRSAEIPFVAPLIVASRPYLRPELPPFDLMAALPAGLTVEAGSAAVDCRLGVEVKAYRVHNAAGQQTPLYLLPGVDVEISASEIREQVRAAAGAPVGNPLLPKAVFDAIRDSRLYL
jgi:nicotinate-nucleotide adenylyltransferase